MKNNALLRALLLSCSFVAVAVVGSPAAEAAPSATAFYERAVAAMQSQPPLPDMAYTIIASSDGGTFTMTPTKTGSVLISVGMGASTNGERIAADYRAADAKVALTVKGAKLGVAPMSLLTPSWQGAYAFMRHGFDSSSTPNASVTPAPMESASPKPALATIAIVQAIGPGFYRVVDNGAAICPNGAPGHALHLIARTDRQAHPLSDVVVDLHSMRFCTMRFGVNRSFGGVFGGTGFIQLNFAPSGKYWIERQATTDLELRGLGIALKHVVLNLAYSGVSFPPSFPASLFATPPPK